ncbi:unnamed protein product [Gongylonema pulchrum]|uniref:PX domain-containing protein n=1 Tax=Gongylonema pulchrum TaxID=637853 RepID=A0A183D0H7_9BILA|nr:unnamed protein product [Gongylonema pulchrum]
MQLAGSESALMKQGTIRMKNINRFSNFVKSGMEGYILSTSRITSKPEEHHEIIVSRRYKHFDWLHEQMSTKYILIPLPPLPEKQVAGRYEEDLIEHRKNILQIWVNKVSRHPVLCKSDVWIHFLTCTDEKQWKSGKRKAERDEYVGGNFLNCVAVPSHPLDSNDVELKVENFSRSMRSLDESVRFMYDRVSETQKRLAGRKLTTSYLFSLFGTSNT